MLSLLKKDRATCKSLRDSLDDPSGIAALSLVQQQHLAACPDCQSVADDALMARSLLQEIPSATATPAPWFAPRVMAAIAARESELRQSFEAWAAVPRLAGRLAWASALMLLLAGTWLYERPRPVPTSAANQSAVESLFDSAPYAGPQDDALLAQEKGQ
jgi:hypothetical protein